MTLLVLFQTLKQTAVYHPTQIRLVTYRVWKEVIVHPILQSIFKVTIDIKFPHFILQKQ